MKHNNPQPKFKKPYLSWMGRANSLKKHLEATGHIVNYTDAGAFVMHSGRCMNKPKRWWEAWKWW